MAGPYQAGEPSTEVGGAWRTPGKGPDDDLEVRVGYSVVHAQANSYYLAGVVLSELRLAQGKRGCYVMLRGKRRGKKLVAFMHGATWRDALVIAATALDTNRVPWNLDTWKPKG